MPIGRRFPNDFDLDTPTVDDVIFAHDATTNANKKFQVGAIVDLFDTAYATQEELDALVISGGGISIASEAETLAGVNDTKAVSPLKLAAATPVRTVDDAADGSGIAWIAHRGAPNKYPEETLEAYRECVANGATVIEADVYLLADGRLGVMHDATVDRTTTGTGNTATQTGATWAALRVDDGDRLGGRWTGTRLAVPFLEDVIREFGNKVVLAIEGKNAGACDAIVTMLQQYRVHPRAAVVASFTLADLASAVAAGYVTEHQGEGTPTPADIAAFGVERVALPVGVSQATVDAYAAAGLVVGLYTINRRSSLTVTGVSFVYSDDPFYMSGRHAKSMTDPYDRNEWWDGSNVVSEPGAVRGQVIGGEYRIPAAVGLVMLKGALQGWLSPLPSPTAFVLDFKVRFNSEDTANRWAFVDVTTVDLVNTVQGASPGYRFLMRKSGTVELYETDGASSALLGTGGGTVTAIADGASATYRITVTATQLTLARLDVANSVTVSDNTQRGEYVTFGCQRSAVDFYDVTLS